MAIASSAPLAERTRGRASRRYLQEPISCRLAEKRVGSNVTELHGYVNAVGLEHDVLVKVGSKERRHAAP